MHGLLSIRNFVSVSPHFVLKRLQPLDRSFLACLLYTNASDKRVGDMIVKRFDPDDHQIMSDLLLRNFFTKEPMGIALGLNVENEVKSWFPKYVKAKLAASPPVSTRAVDVNTEKIVAVNFATIIDPNQSNRVEMEDFISPAKQPVFSIICRFLKELGDGVDAAELLGLKSISGNDIPKTLYHDMITVADEHTQKGVAKALVGLTHELARKVPGCTASCVSATSEYSYRIYLAEGYQVIREVEYLKYVDPVMDLIFRGKEQKLGEHLCARIMIRDLN